MSSVVRSRFELARAAQTFLVLHEFPPHEIADLWRSFLSRIDSPSHYDAPEYFFEPQWAGKKPFVILSLYHDDIVGVASGIHANGCTVCGLISRPQVRIDDAAEPLLASSYLAEGLM